METVRSADGGSVGVGSWYQLFHGSFSLMLNPLGGSRRVTPDRSECTGGIRTGTYNEQPRGAR